MAGSIIGLEQKGLQDGFGTTVMVGVGNPNNIVLAPSGTFLRDYVNDAQYKNVSANGAVGSSWWTIGSVA